MLGAAPHQLEELTVTAYSKVYTGRLATFGQRMLTTAALEVYRRIVEAPIEFQSMGSGCVVLITTK